MLPTHWSFAALAPVRCALLAVLALASLPSLNARAAQPPVWTTQSPRGTVDAGFNTACGPSPVLLDAAGNAVLVRIFNNGPGLTFLSIAKFDAAGDLLWRVDDSGASRAHYFPGWSCNAALDADGNVLIASEGQPFPAPNIIGLFYRRLAVAKYSSADGTRAWLRESDTVDASYIGGIAADQHGDVFVMARGQGSPPLRGSQTLIAKYRGDTGAPAWPDRPDGELVTSAYYARLAIAQGTDLVLAAAYQATRLSGATGNTVWFEYVPEVAELDYGSSFAGLLVDGSGDVLMATAEYTSEIEVTPGSYYLFRDYITVKLSGATGDPVWTALPKSLSRYDGPALRDDMATALAFDASGNVIVHGASQAGGMDNEHYDFATLKLDSASGAPTWSGATAGAARYNGAGQGRDWGTAVATDASGDVFVTGASINAAGNEDFLTRKLSGATGQPLWSGLPDFSASHDGSLGSSDAAQGLAVGTSGDVFVVGREAAVENDDQVLIRYDGATGTPLWSARSEPTVERHEQLSEDQRRTTVVDATGNTFVAGITFNGFCNEWLIMKIGPDGARVWTQRFSPARTPFFHPCGGPFAIALDADGDVFVTGQLGSDIATAKFAASDGAPLWTGLPDAMAAQNVPYQNHAGYALAVDSQGDVVVAAGIAPFNSPSASHLRTFKYDGESGALVWTGQHGANPWYIRSGTLLVPSAVAVDAAGNAFVSVGGFGNNILIKYDGATGTPLWSNYPDGVMNLPCNGSAMVLDQAGNPIVACSDGDIVTILYSSVNGTPLWAHLPDGKARYNGPANGSDAGHAIAVGAEGDIFVAGTSVGSDGQADWVIIRYAGADATPRWPGIAVRQDGPLSSYAPMTLSLSGQYIALSGQTARTAAGPGTGAWSVFDASSGALRYTQALPEGSAVRSAVVGPDGDIRIAGTVNDPAAPAIYVSRIASEGFPLFRSGFE
jgi:hypothetical protein